MDDKVRLIDAEALKNYMCSACPNKERCEDTEQVCSAILDVDEQPTIEAEPDNGWISVKDRLPPYGERVLVVNETYETERGYTRYDIGITVRDSHLNFTFWGHKVTYWMPLPEQPIGMITSSILNKVKRALYEMPSADDQSAKHAKWISYGRDNDWMKYYRCSSCSSEIVDASGLAEVRKKYRFCPQCGCKMDGDSNGKD